MRMRHSGDRSAADRSARRSHDDAPRAIWAIGCGQLVNWGVLFFAYSVLLVPLEDAFGAPRWLVAGAFSFGLLVSAIAAPAVGRLADRGQGPAVMQAGGLLAAGLLIVWALVPTIWMTYLVWGGARPVHGLDPLRTGLCHRRPRVRRPGRAAARDRHGDRNGRTCEHRVSARHLGARDAVRLARHGRRAGHWSWSRPLIVSQLAFRDLAWSAPTPRRDHGSAVGSTMAPASSLSRLVAIFAMSIVVNSAVSSNLVAALIERD